MSESKYIVPSIEALNDRFTKVRGLFPSEMDLWLMRNPPNFPESGTVLEPEGAAIWICQVSFDLNQRSSLMGYTFLILSKQVIEHLFSDAPHEWKTKLADLIQSSLDKKN